MWNFVEPETWCVPDFLIGQTEKFRGFKNFQEFRGACRQAVLARSKNKKGANEDTGRLHLDISCSITKFLVVLGS